MFYGLSIMQRLAFYRCLLPIHFFLQHIINGFKKQPRVEGFRDARMKPLLPGLCGYQIPWHKQTRLLREQTWYSPFIQFFKYRNAIHVRQVDIQMNPIRILRWRNAYAVFAG
ncbi:MAG: hypothetical protein IIA62_10175 [Nitrospinae bacterium]|nr:hypothetical protein [Nitrospinota bacterium]